jgi:hypothetical protein
LAIANIPVNEVWVMLGNGDGTFDSAARFAAGNSPNFVAAGDFNSDGRQDLAVTDYNSGSISVLLNQGVADTSPSAVAGADFSLQCTARGSLRLDGSASSDPDSTPGTNDDIVSFEWYENFGTPSQILLGEGETLNVPVYCGRNPARFPGTGVLRLSRGTHLITLKVIDRAGMTGTDSLVVKVTTPGRTPYRATEPSP